MSVDPMLPTNEPFASLESLGTLLRQTREARGLTLGEVSHDTYIRLTYLEALENGKPSQLPEAIYVRGFLKRYADYLGLEGEVIVKRALPLFTRREALKPIAAQPKPNFSLRPLHLWTAYVVLIVVAIGSLSAFLEGGINPFKGWLQPLKWVRSVPWPPQPEGVSQSPPTTTESLDQTPRQVFADITQWTAIAGVFPPSPITADSSKPVQLDIRVVERPSWLRVVADGQTVFEATLQPGAELNYSADQSIVLRAGNAGGVLVTFNNQDLGVMGSFGEVKEQVYERPVSSFN
ncbi:MAG: DUF4115 domain-containing protein [Cyanobacteriota bacterium]|nr:DUF4115 domain-containing protein [Cyanobacteriota bacterium]